MKRNRFALWGGSAAVLYVVIALTTLHGVPVRRPLYDGSGPPPPYRWVKPPPELAAGNQEPSSATDRFAITTPGYSLSTDDGQAVLIIPPGGIVKKPGETTVNTKIDPLDPSTLGIPAPSGRSYDGNAYRFTATYAKSGQPAEIATSACGDPSQPSKCATVVVRFAFNATELYRLDGSTWTKVPSTPAGASLQIYGDTPKLGTFAAVDIGSGNVKPKARGRSGDFLAFGLGLAAILAGTLLARARAVRRRKRGAEQEPARKPSAEPKKRPQRTAKDRARYRLRRALRWLKK